MFNAAGRLPGELHWLLTTLPGHTATYLARSEADISTEPSGCRQDVHLRLKAPVGVAHQRGRRTDSMPRLL